MLDPRMNPWDCAALILITKPAVGFMDWRGRVVIDGGDVVSTNGILHDLVLQRLLVTQSIPSAEPWAA